MRFVALLRATHDPLHESPLMSQEGREFAAALRQATIAKLAL